MKRKDIYISILLTYIVVLTSIVLYLTWLRYYFEIPECPIYKTFGIYCPACGGTRAIISLANADIINSFLYNPIVIYSFAFSTLYLIIETINIKLKKNIIIPWKGIIKFGLVLLLINWMIKIWR